MGNWETEALGVCRGRPKHTIKSHNVENNRMRKGCESLLLSKYTQSFFFHASAGTAAPSYAFALGQCQLLYRPLSLYRGLFDFMGAFFLCGCITSSGHWKTPVRYAVLIRHP